MTDIDPAALDRELKKGAAELLLLSLLDARPRHGYELSGLLEARSRARGVSVDDYFKANLLRRETTGADVAGAFLYLATAEATTGCVITVDGGNAAAFPR